VRSQKGGNSTPRLIDSDNTRRRLIEGMTWPYCDDGQGKRTIEGAATRNFVCRRILRQQSWWCVNLVLMLDLFLVCCCCACLAIEAAEDGSNVNVQPSSRNSVVRDIVVDWKLPVGCDWSGFFVEMLGYIPELERRVRKLILSSGKCGQGMLGQLTQEESKVVSRSQANSVEVTDAGKLVVIHHSEPCTWISGDRYPVESRPIAVVGRTMTEVRRSIKILNLSLSPQPRLENHISSLSAHRIDHAKRPGRDFWCKFDLQQHFLQEIPSADEMARIAECSKRVNSVWLPTPFHRDVFAKAGVPVHKLAVVPEAVNDVFLSYGGDAVNQEHQQPTEDGRGVGTFTFLSIFKVPNLICRVHTRCIPHNHQAMQS